MWYSWGTNKRTHLWPLVKSTLIFVFQKLLSYGLRACKWNVFYSRQWTTDTQTHTHTETLSTHFPFIFIHLLANKFHFFFNSVSFICMKVCKQNCQKQWHSRQVKYQHIINACFSKLTLLYSTSVKTQTTTLSCWLLVKNTFGGICMLTHLKYGKIWIYCLQLQPDLIYILWIPLTEMLTK